MRVELSEYVEGDIQQIADYIAQDSHERALHLLEEIYDMIRRIGRNPLYYPVRVEIARDARLAVVGRYVVLFRIIERCVRIERVVFGGRDLPALLA
jgi:plasmid stabilization system protein ParE